ncbi:tyrosine-type recombinase/integrase [Lysinibacillus sphaericus]|uniref:tyrosine-type recombinase/integrase n=1 Tax=Lysinibacillus sphaericus TaxID=1421 RepID=UPI0009B728B6
MTSIEQKLQNAIKYKKHDHVFINIRTLECIGRNLVNHILYTAYNNKAISKRITPHGLRHSYATILCAKVYQGQ